MFTATRRDLLNLAAGAALAAGAPRAFGAAQPFAPRYAICNETFGDWPFEKAFAFAAECGYQGIEFAPFTLANNVADVSAAKRRETRRQVEAAGLKTVGLHWLLARTQGLHLTSADAATREKTAAYLGELARFCADLGGDLLVFGSPQQRNLPADTRREDGDRRALDVITRALPVFEETNITFALEPLSPKTTNYLTTAAEAAALAAQLDSPRVRVILDCLAMSSESAPIPKLIAEQRGRFAHFHANDPNAQGPGFGQLDFGPIMQALADIEYGGWISVEVFDYKPGPERLAKESIDYMRKCVAALR